MKFVQANKWTGLLLAVVFAVLSSCGADDDGIPDYIPDIEDQVASNCCNRCFMAINDCHVNAVGITGEEYCTQFCAGLPSEKDVACMESANCQVIKSGYLETSLVCGALVTPVPSCCSRCLNATSLCSLLTIGIPEIDYCSAFCGDGPVEDDKVCLESTDCETITGGVQQSGVVCGGVVTLPYSPSATAPQCCSKGQ
jgi:hypothetical protein